MATMSAAKVDEAVPGQAETEPVSREAEDVESLAPVRLVPTMSMRSRRETLRKSSMLLTGRPSLLSKLEVQKERSMNGKLQLMPLYARNALAGSKMPQIFIFEVRRTMFGLGFLMLQDVSRTKQPLGTDQLVRDPQQQQQQQQGEKEEEEEEDSVDSDVRNNGSIGDKVERGRVRISQVFTDNRGPIIKNTSVRSESLLETGDVILQIGDCPIENIEEANTAVHETEIGTYVTVHIMRGGPQAPGRRSRATRVLGSSANGPHGLDTESTRAERRKRTILQRAKTEEERIFRESKNRFERRLEALEAARESHVLRDFVSGCAKLISAPEVELLCALREAFGGVAPVPAASPATCQRGPSPCRTFNLDLTELPETHPIQVLVLFQTLARHLGPGGALGNCAELSINFGWRGLDRLSLYALSLLYAVDEAAQRVQVQAEEVDTRKDFGLEKEFLHGAPFARIVRETLPSMLRLGQVCLASSGLDDETVADLVAALQGCPCLQTLDLRRNSFGPLLARELGAALVDPECGLHMSLETVDLSWNELGGEGVKVLCGQLGEASSSSLTELKLAFNGVTDECAPSLRELLASNVLQQLQKVDLSHNRLSGAAGSHLSSALRENTTLTDFSVSFNAIGVDATLLLVSSVFESNVLTALWTENTTGDASVVGAEGAVFESSEGSRAPTFCDGLVQFVWELKEHMNMLRLQRELETIEVHVEYPVRLRHVIGGVEWYKPYLGIENALGVGDEGMENGYLDLSNSIFRTRPKEADSRAFFDTFPVVQSAMYTDWQFLEPKLQRFIKEAADVQGVQAVLGESFFELYNIHRYYAAIGNDHDCIGFNEFMDVVFDCHISDASCPDNAAQQAFVAANVELKAESKEAKLAMDQNPDNALCLYEFVEALVRLSMRKFCDEKKSTRRASGPTEAFSWLLTENVFPHCKRIRSNVFRRDKLYYYDVVVVLTTYRLKIERLWKEYAGVAGAHVLMKKDHWLEMLSVTGVSKAASTQPDRKKSAIFSPLVMRMAFWAAQTMDRNKLVRNVRDRARNTSDALSYTEFLEAIVWLADTIQQPATLRELGLAADAFVSEKLVCVLEMLLGSAAKDCFGRASYPALLADLRGKHEPMQYPDRSDYAFEAGGPDAEDEGSDEMIESPAGEAGGEEETQVLG